MSSFLKEKKLFLLDMDGTLYLDDDLFEGVEDFLSHIKKSGGRYMFLTNNSSKSVDKYIEKMRKLGIETVDDDFLTSTNATCIYLEKNYKDKKIYAFGTEAFKDQLRKSGFNITDKLEDDIEVLVMGFDTELTFKKLEAACILLNRGVTYIATNPDWVCPTWYGSVPDCGSVSAMLFNATGRNPLFIGKPQPEMIYLAMEKAGCTKEETVLFGDRIYTDIRSGYNAGIDTVFVLSGEGTMKNVEESDFKPTYIKENVKQVYDEMKK